MRRKYQSKIVMAGFFLTAALLACIRHQATLETPPDRHAFNVMGGNPLLNGVLVKVTWEGDELATDDESTRLQFYGSNPALPLLQSRWIDLVERPEITGCGLDIINDAYERDRGEVPVCDRQVRVGDLRSVSCIRGGERREARLNDKGDIKPGLRSFEVDCLALGEKAPILAH